MTTTDDFEADPPDAGQTCPSCRSSAVSRRHVRAAWWNGERLVVVDGVPATVCEACGEMAYDPAAEETLDAMKSRGFPPAWASRYLQVPIFEYGGPSRQRRAHG